MTKPSFIARQSSLLPAVVACRPFMDDRRGMLHLQMQPEPEGLLITAMDHHFMGVQMVLPGTVQASVACKASVNREVLEKILRNLDPDQHVCIQKDGDMLEISSGRCRFRLVTADPDIIFPHSHYPYHDLASDAEFKPIDPIDLRLGIAAVLPCLPNRHDANPDPDFKGARVGGEPPRMIATDRYKLGRCLLPQWVLAQDSILYKELLEAIRNIFDDLEDVQVGFAGDNLLMEQGDRIYVWSHIPEIKNPDLDLDALIPAGPQKYTIEVSKDHICQALKRMAVFSGMVTLTISSGQIVIHAKSDGYEAREAIPYIEAVYDSVKVPEVSFDPVKLLSILGAIRSEEVLFSFESASSRVNIYSRDPSPDATYLLMPMRTVK